MFDHVNLHISIDMVYVYVYGHIVCLLPTGHVYSDGVGERLPDNSTDCSQSV